MLGQRLLVEDKVSTGILDINRCASKWLVLVSPYLDLTKWDHSQQAIVSNQQKWDCDNLSRAFSGRV